METLFSVVSSKGGRIDMSPEDDNDDVRARQALGSGHERVSRVERWPELSPTPELLPMF